MKVIANFLLLFFMSCSVFYAQQPDTAKVSRYLGKAENLLDSAYYKKAVELLEPLKNQLPWNTMDSLAIDYFYTYGNALRRTGQNNKAIKQFSKAQTLSEKIFGLNNQKTIDIYTGIGWSLNNQGNHTKALEWFEKALQNSLNIPGNPYVLIANAHNGIGYTYHRLGKENLALKHLFKSVEIFENNPAHLFESYAYDNLGTLYSDKRVFDKAIEYYTKALEVRKSFLGSDHPFVAQTYYSLAHCFSESNNLEKPFALSKKALDIDLRWYGENNINVAWGYSRLAYYSWVLDENLNEGVENAKKAISIFTALGHGISLASGLTYNHLGICYQKLGELDKSIDTHKKALEIRIKTFGPNHGEVASSNNNIGVNYVVKGEYEKALSYFLAALDYRIYYDEYYHPYTALYYRNVGISYLNLEEYNEALPYLEKSMEVYSSPQVKGHYQEYLAPSSLGWYYYKIKDFKKSYNYYQRALEIARKAYPQKNATIAYLYKDIASVLMEQEHYDQAQVYIDSSYYALNFNNDDDNFEKVISEMSLLDAFYQEAEFFQQIYQKTKERKFLEDLQANRQQALKLLDVVASDLSESSSKSGLLNRNYTSFEMAIWTELQLAENQAEVFAKIFTMVEKSKAIQLLESFYNEKAQAIANLPDSLLSQENDLKKSITDLEKKCFDEEQKGEDKDEKLLSSYYGQIYELKQSYSSLSKHLEEQYPSVYKLKYGYSVSTVHEIKTLLKDDQAFIEYFVGDSSIFLLLIARDTLVVKDIKKDFPLEDWVEQMREGMFAHSPINKISSIEKDSLNRQYLHRAFQLYEKLIKPITAFIEDENKLVIVPDGVLGYLSFDALLRTPVDDFKSFNTPDYLLRDYQISYVYSATFWLEMVNKKIHPKKNLMAFAPDFPEPPEYLALKSARDGLYRLQFSLPEVQSINDIWGADIFQDASASLQNFLDKASAYRILHLSTHGKADDRTGDYCFLAFTATSDSLDDLLYVRDLYNMELNAEMVVLSACETGLGELQRGEGIISLARGFTYAGAKSIVSTLWSVNEHATKEIMENFYINLKKGMDKDNALQQAKLTYLDSSNPAAPFYWAGFTAVGDMSPVKKSGFRWYYALIGLLILSLFFLFRKLF